MRVELEDETPTHVLKEGIIWNVEQKSTRLYLLTGPGICWLTETELTDLLPKKPGLPSRIPNQRLRKLHRTHIYRGRSIRDLGREVQEEFGYTTAKSAAMAISTGFKRLELPARQQNKATGLNNKQRRLPDSPGTKDRAEYKRWLLEKKGHRRRCKGKKQNAPGRGRPCDAWALNDSDFCRNHDPRFQEQIQKQLREMRGRVGRDGSAVPA